MLINQGGASYEEAEAQAEAYRVANGLNEPLPVQYVNWIIGIVTRCDFGHSLFYNKPVGEVVAERLPRTLIAGADLPHPGVASSASPRHHRRDAAI